MEAKLRPDMHIATGQAYQALNVDRFEKKLNRKICRIREVMRPGVLKTVGSYR